MIYGYCRISTPRQNIERQVRNIKAEYPDAVIFKESYTGTKLDRPEWNKLMRKIKPGDSIIFDSVSRMSRNAEDGIALYMELYKRGIDLVFLKEPLINTAVYKETARRAVPMTGTDVDVILQGINQYLLLLAERQIALAFGQAQKEVNARCDHTDQIDRHGEYGRVDALVDGRVIGTHHITSAEKYHQCGGRIDDDTDDIRAIISCPDLVGHDVAVLGIRHQGLQNGRESIDEGNAEDGTEDGQHGLAVQSLSLHDVGQRQHDDGRCMDLRRDQHNQDEPDIFPMNHQIKGRKGHAHGGELADTVLHPRQVVR